HERGRHEHVIADEKNRIARGEIEANRKHAAVVLMFMRADDLAGMAIGFGTMLSKDIQDALFGRRSIVDQNEFGGKTKSRQRVEDGSKAGRRKLRVVASWNNNAEHWAGDPKAARVFIRRVPKISSARHGPARCALPG